MSEAKYKWKTSGWGYSVQKVEFVKETNKTLITIHEWCGRKEERKVMKGRDYYDSEIAAYQFQEQRIEDNLKRNQKQTDDLNAAMNVIQKRLRELSTEPGKE